MGLILHTYPAWVPPPGHVRREFDPDIAKGPHPGDCLGCRIDALLMAPKEKA